MALGRKRMEDPTLKNWEQVDEALKTIAEAGNELEMLHSAMNLQVDALKKQFDEAARPYHEKIKQNELLVKEFASASRTEMDGKSKKTDLRDDRLQDEHKAGVAKGCGEGHRQSQEIRHGEMHHYKGIR